MDSNQTIGIVIVAKIENRDKSTANHLNTYYFGNKWFY